MTGQSFGHLGPSSRHPRVLLHMLRRRLSDSKADGNDGHQKSECKTISVTGGAVYRCVCAINLRSKGLILCCFLSQIVLFSVIVPPLPAIACREQLAGLSSKVRHYIDVFNLFCIFKCFKNFESLKYTSDIYPTRMQSDDGAFFKFHDCLYYTHLLMFF